MSLTPTDVHPVQSPASLSPRPCTCVAVSFTWQDLPALPVMAILARSSLLPGLTVSCHGWRLICILQLESVVSALVLLMRRTVGRHAVITYCTLAIRPRPQQQAYAAVVKVGALSFIWIVPLPIEEIHLVYTSRIGIHLPHRFNSQNLQTKLNSPHPFTILNESRNSLGKTLVPNKITHTSEEEILYPLTANPKIENTILSLQRLLSLAE